MHGIFLPATANPYLANCQLPVTAIREMKILNELSHPSMVRLLEIVTSVGEVNMQGSVLICYTSLGLQRKKLLLIHHTVMTQSPVGGFLFDVLVVVQPSVIVKLLHASLCLFSLSRSPFISPLSQTGDPIKRLFVGNP